MNDQDGKIKSFVKEHKRELLVGAGIIITGGVIVHLKTVSDIAMNSLNREERRVLFEQKEIWDKQARFWNSVLILSAISGMERGAGQQDINSQEPSDYRDAWGAQRQ